MKLSKYHKEDQKRKKQSNERMQHIGVMTAVGNLQAAQLRAGDRMSTFAPHLTLHACLA